MLGKGYCLYRQGSRMPNFELLLLIKGDYFNILYFETEGVLVCKIRIVYLSLRRRCLRLGVLKCTGCGGCACHTTATRTSFVRNRSGRRDALGPGAAGRPGQVARHVQCTVLRATRQWMAWYVAPRRPSGTPYTCSSVDGRC
jgi:hypothetical protein